MHKRNGLLYYCAMIVTLLSAVIMSFFNLFQYEFEMAGFLGFLSVLTAFHLWYSYAILQQGESLLHRYYMIRKYFTLLLFLLSLSMFGLAAYYKFQGAGIVFAFIAALSFPALFEYLQKKPKVEEVSKYRVYEHLRGVIVSGIATYTAFFAFGGRTFLGYIFKDMWMLVPWIAPTVIGLIATQLLKKKYAILNESKT